MVQTTPKIRKSEFHNRFSRLSILTCLSSWSFKQKWAVIAIVSGFTFIVPVSSSVVAPATNQVATQFGIHSSVIIALTTSIFVLAYSESNLVQRWVSLI